MNVSETRQPEVEQNKSDPQNPPKADKRIFAAKYFEGYELQSVPKKNGKGYCSKRVYVGDVYKISETSGMNALKLKFALLVIASLVLLFAGGLWRSNVNTAAIVVFPYVIALCAELMALVGITRFVLSNGSMTKYSYVRYCRETLGGASVATTFMVIAVLCSVYLLIREAVSDGEIEILSYIIPIMCFLLSGLLTFGIRREYKMTSFKEIKGREPYEERL